MSNVDQQQQENAKTGTCVAYSITDLMISIRFKTLVKYLFQKSYLKRTQFKIFQYLLRNTNVQVEEVIEINMILDSLLQH